MDLTNLLAPTGRKALYAIVTAVATLVVVLGIAPDVAVQNWVEVVVQVLGIVGLVLASIKAKRVDFTVFYGAAAALVAALTAVGVIKDGASSQIYDVLAQFAVAFPLLWATMRTNTQTPTGEPQAEYVAEHAAPVLNAAAEPRNELGAVNLSIVYVVAAVVIIVVGLVWLAGAL